MTSEQVPRLFDFGLRPRLFDFNIYIYINKYKEKEYGQFKEFKKSIL